MIQHEISCIAKDGLLLSKRPSFIFQKLIFHTVKDKLLKFNLKNTVLLLVANRIIHYRYLSVRESENGLYGFGIHTRTRHGR